MGGSKSELVSDGVSSCVTTVNTKGEDDVDGISSTGEDDTSPMLATDGVIEAMVGSPTSEVKEITGCEGREEGSEVPANVTITDILLGVGSTEREVKEGTVNSGTELEVSVPMVWAGEATETGVMMLTDGAREDGDSCGVSTNDNSEGVSEVNEGVSSMLEDSLKGGEGSGRASEDEVTNTDSVKEGESLELVVCTITSEDSPVNVSSGTDS